MVGGQVADLEAEAFSESPPGLPRWNQASALLPQVHVDLIEGEEEAQVVQKPGTTGTSSVGGTAAGGASLLSHLQSIHRRKTPELSFQVVRA